MTRWRHFLIGHLVIIISCFFAQLSNAGAWTQRKNAWQLITTASAYKASHYFDANGKKRSQVPFYKEELSHYAEYGWRDDITLGGQFGLARAIQASATTAKSSSGWRVGDSELFLRKQLWEHAGQIFSVQPFVMMPSHNQTASSPKIGSDHAAAGVKLSYGRSMQAFGKSHYASITTGYTHRYGTPHDQIHLEATLGMTISQHWQIMPQAFITHTPHQRSNASFTQSNNDDYDLSKLQLSALYKIHEHGQLQLGAFANVQGRNTGNGYGAVLGYWRSF